MRCVAYHHHQYQRPRRQRRRRRRRLQPASAVVLVATLTAVASVVTPTVVPTVEPTALRHQNAAIATAAMALASSMRGAVRSFIIPLTLSSICSFSAYANETSGCIRPDVRHDNGGREAQCLFRRARVGENPGYRPRQTREGNAPHTTRTYASPPSLPSKDGAESTKFESICCRAFLGCGGHSPPPRRSAAVPTLTIVATSEPHFMIG
jgi:hypothetical protein